MVKIRRAGKQLYAGRLRNPKAARQSMAVLDERLATEFKERTRRQARFVEQMKKYRALPQDVSSKRKQATKVIDAIRGLQMDASKHTVWHPQSITLQGRPSLARGPQHMVGRISRPGWPTWPITSLFVDTAVPPYQWGSYGYSLSGTLQKNSESVDLSSGDESIDIESGFKYGTDGVLASANAGVAVDIYPARSGSLQVWSSPALNYSWGYWLDDPTSHESIEFGGGVSSTGWVGLWVYEYSANDPFGHFVFDQKVILWDSSYASASGSGQGGAVQWQEGSSPAFGLYVPPIQMTPGNGYTIWALSGADIWAQAEGYSTSALAWAILNISVPFVVWEVVVPTLPPVLASKRRLSLTATR